MFINRFNTFLRAEAGEAGDAGGGQQSTPADASTGLLSSTPATPGATPAATPAEIPAAKPADESTPGNNGIPAIVEFINKNPDLAPYQKQLGAKFDKAMSTDELVPSVLKSYAELEKFKGLPAEGATEQQIAQYRKLNGVPETADGYNLVGNEALKALGVDEKTAKAYETAFHGANLTPAQVNQVIKNHSEVVGQMVTAQQQAQEAKNVEAANQIRQEMGAGFSAFQSNAQKAHDIAVATAGLTPEETAKYLSDPTYFKLMGAIAKRFEGTPIIKGGVEGMMQGDRSRAEAMAKDPKNPMHDPSHQDHRKASEEYFKLMASTQG